MRYWLFMFRPDTYDQVKKHTTVGVRDGVQKRFSELRPKDKFVSYVSRVQDLDGYGEIVGVPFVENTLIFSKEKVYQHRCKVKFVKTNANVFAGDILWFLETFDGLFKTSPSNMIFCKGGFIEITEKDYRTLTELIDDPPQQRHTALKPKGKVS